MSVDRIGPPCPYRAAGFTWQAGLYPLSADGVEIVAAHNGVAASKLARGARYAPNPWMLAWIESLGERLAAGLPWRDPDGRWLTPDRLAAQQVAA